MPSLSAAYDVCLLDLDGVVYIGPDAAPYAREALRVARADGMRLAFVTNNASRTPETVAAHLRELGIQTSAQEIVTSAQAAARMLSDRLPEGSAVLVIGGAGLVEAVRERGLIPVASCDDDPVAVVQGFDPAVDWRMLAEGTYAVSHGLPWVASNTDTTIPTARGTAPGNGALVQVIATVTGRSPDVAGKPEPPMHAETVLRTGARRPLVVGDRLDTDIEGANRSGVDSLLVLTGITTPTMLPAAEPLHRPTLVGPDLRALAAEPGAVVIEPGRAAYGRWRAGVRRGRLTIEERSGGADPPASPWDAETQDRLDGLRAICGAVWSVDTTASDDHVGGHDNGHDNGRDDGRADHVQGVAAALKVIGW